MSFVGGFSPYGCTSYNVSCIVIVPLKDRFDFWYQDVTLAVGGLAFVLPIVLIVSWHLTRRIYRTVERFSTSLQKDPSPNTRPNTPYDSECQVDWPLISVLPYAWPQASSDDESAVEPEEEVKLNPEDSKVGCLDIAALQPNALTVAQIDHTVEFVASVCKEQDFAALAIRCGSGSAPAEVKRLLSKLNARLVETKVVFQAHHDATVWADVDLVSTAGVIIENACVMPHGDRRDYFHSQALRRIVSDCAAQRESKPDYFIGFLELWENQPHQAIIRRAIKLAEHFGAHLEHGMASSIVAGDKIVPAANTLSAFEYLKRSEITRLQTTWTSSSRKVNISSGASGARSLNPKMIASVVPDATELFVHQDIPQELALVKVEDPVFVPSPEYLAVAPKSDSFWHCARDGSPLSPHGCFSIYTEPTVEDYAAIVQSQKHLKDLNLLLFVEGSEAARLIQALRTLSSKGRCASLVQDLIMGLESQDVCVYKGLDTGFRLPEGATSFLGVSSNRDATYTVSVDIYISQKAPNATAAVLHTWLAHHRVGRDVRFEYEAMLESSTLKNANGIMPTSIASSISAATHAETLQLLERVNVTGLEGRLREAIVGHCQLVLIDQTTVAQRMFGYGRRLLDGSMTVEEALASRLADYVRLGATSLPTLPNLVKLYHLLDAAVRDALFNGNRTHINSLALALRNALNPFSASTEPLFIDVNADLFALMFFTILRRSAFEEVYVESTDRCPLMLQPDQAAVFSELWVLGSQCEVYFGILPRDLGEIIYTRYRTVLEQRPPVLADRENNEIMTMYCDVTASTKKAKKPTRFGSTTIYERKEKLKLAFAEFGAVSFFCMPAIIDVVMLTFLRRGLLLTANMGTNVQPAVYGVLLSLILSSGIVGWAGSTGNYYLAHYAYDNMIHFHVSRLASGLILSFIFGVVGMIILCTTYKYDSGYVFLGYMVAVTSYLNLLGILATMHQKDSPLTSGRVVVWRTLPMLLISPILSLFIRGYDIGIYLTVIYVFLLALVYQYSMICHEWSGWIDKMHKFGEKDILTWHEKLLAAAENKGKLVEKVEKEAADPLEDFSRAIDGFSRRTAEARSKGWMEDELVDRVATSMPYINWLFKKAAPNGKLPPAFTSGWFTQLGEAQNQQKQLIRGLKEHNIVILFRMARYDIGQSVGLFLVALMDRWVGIVMSGREPRTDLYHDGNMVFTMCFCIVYFCLSVMVLDMVLLNYWGFRFEASKEALVDYKHAVAVKNAAEHKRRVTFLKALCELLLRLLILFGAATLLLWLFTNNPQPVSIFYLYMLGYTSVIIFQFNRCFTTNVKAHITTIFVCAFIGFATGCVLRAIPATAESIYSETVAQTTAAVLAALGTSLWCWKDFFAKKPNPLARIKAASSDQDGLWIQRKLSCESEIRTNINPTQAQRIGGRVMKGRVNSPVCEDVGRRLRDSLAQSKHAGNGQEIVDLLQTAVDLWQNGNIEVVAVPSVDFVALGFGEACSFAHLDAESNLSIKLGMFGEAELGLPSWHPVLSIVAAECILYHVARIEFGHTHSQAVRAEHYLQGTVNMSKRIEIEILVADNELISKFIGKTNTEVMRRLCWNLDVDVEWQALPQSVREAILLRISEKPIAWDEDVRTWVESRAVDIPSSDFHLLLALAVFRACWQRCESNPALLADAENMVGPESNAELMPVRIVNGHATLVERIFGSIISGPLSAVKWIAIISGGATNIERELQYKFQDVPLGNILLRCTLAAWRFCRFVRESMLHALVIYKRHSLRSVAKLVFHGERRQMTNSSIAVVRPRKPITAFVSNECDDETVYLALNAYDDSLQTAPENKSPSFKAMYDDAFRLKRREESDGTFCTYTYNTDRTKRWPLYREHFDKDTKIVGFYDKYGRIQHGTMTMGTTEITFVYHYKATPKGSSSILRADFAHGTTSVSLNKLSVYWGEPPREDEITVCDWVPSDKVYRIDRMVDGKSYVTEMEYRHRRDPISTTFLKDDSEIRTAVADVPKVFFENVMLLKKPHRPSFDADDLLIYHSTRLIRHLRHSVVPTLSFLSRWSLLKYFGRNVKISLPTWRIRTELWHGWLKGNIDAPTVCWLDEIILRQEPLLLPYWSGRESGQLVESARNLNQHINQIASAIELETDVAELCLLPIKTTDLYHMGLGRDATEITTRPQDCYADTKDRVSVIVNDIGCWPESPGGVSNCRRDLVNGHSTIRNHVLAECANDYGIPRFQIERNVQSLKLLPLWGLDDKTAYHGLTENILQSQVDIKIHNTDKHRDIQGVFIPLLMDFVKGARTKTYSRADLIKYTNVFLSMAKYYESKDYNLTWNSEAVAEAWGDAWLVPYNDPNIYEPSENFELQRPSRHDFRDAMGIYMAYFFIFSVQVPEECPRVFQSTHHGISSLFGMILKYKRGVTFGIWDHAILWRETCLNISPAQCELSIPVQSMLLGGIRLASRLSYFHADMIVPCTSLFNPMWEADIGTDRGQLSNKNEFVRKIDPIVNGISNMDSFTPVKATRTDKPTAVMLSNVQFIKGIRTAIVAADVIVNRFGFKDYKLLIYGAKDRQPSYALEMAKLIVKCGLSDNVVLAGFGKPDQVLQDAWIFVNSSISEGLPLAIGEAALAGVPIVATEVGATALVITDPDNQDERYGEVVAPNDPVSLARAQLRLLCMVGPWAKFTSDGPDSIDLPEEFAPEDVVNLSQRMQDKTEDRHKLGLLSREVVKRSFHGHRYLREHEQMYWVQWHLARMRADPTLNRRNRIAYRFNANPPLMYMDTPMYDELDVDSVIDADVITLNGSTSSRNSIYDGTASPSRSEKRSGLSRLLAKHPLAISHTPSSSITGRSNFENWAPG